MSENEHGQMKFNYLYRNEFPSLQEGYRPIQVRVNKKDVYFLLVTLSCGRYFFPFSIVDIDNVIKELLFVREKFDKEIKEFSK